MANAERDTRIRRPLLALILGGALAISGYTAYSRLTAPLSTSTVETLVADLARARRESQGSLNVYRYRLYHFAQDSLSMKNWDIVERELERQGAIVTGSSPSQTSYRLPKSGMTFGEFEFVPVITVNREESTNPYIEEPTVYWLSSLLLMDRPADFKALRNAMPPNSIVRQELSRPNMIALASTYPVVRSIALRYGSFGQHGFREAGSSMEVMTTLSRQDLLNDEEVVVRSTWRSGLEPAPVRIVSWLPLTHRQARDSLTFFSSLGDLGEYKNARQTYELRRSGFKPEELPREKSVTWYGQLRDLPASDSAISINFSPLREPELLTQHTGLKRLTYTMPLNEDVVRTIASHPSLEALTIGLANTSSAKILSNSKSIRELSVSGSNPSKLDLTPFTQMDRLRSLKLYRIRSADDMFLRAVAKMPNLEELSLEAPSLITASGLDALAMAPKLRKLHLGLHMAPPGTVSHLGPLSSLQSLTIVGAKLDQIDILALASMVNLRELRFQKCQGLNLAWFSGMSGPNRIAFTNCPGVKARDLYALKGLLGNDFIDPDG